MLFRSQIPGSCLFFCLSSCFPSPLCQRSDSHLIVYEIGDECPRQIETFERHCTHPIETGGWVQSSRDLERSGKKIRVPGRVGRKRPVKIAKAVFSSLDLPPNLPLRCSPVCIPALDGCLGNEQRDEIASKIGRASCRERV